MIVFAGSFASVGVFFGAASRRSRRLMRNADDLHGSARWATKDDIRTTGLMDASTEYMSVHGAPRIRIDCNTFGTTARNTFWRLRRLAPAGSGLNAQKKGAAAAAPVSPAAAAAPPSGATASTAPLEVEMLSYSALDAVLEKVAGYTCSVKPSFAAAAPAFSKILVLDSPTLQALKASFYANAKALEGVFDSMTAKGGAGAGPDDFADVTNAVAAAEPHRPRKRHRRLPSRIRPPRSSCFDTCVTKSRAPARTMQGSIR